MALVRVRVKVRVSEPSRWRSPEPLTLASYAACEGGNLLCVRMMLEAKADIEARHNVDPHRPASPALALTLSLALAPTPTLTPSLSPTRIEPNPKPGPNQARRADLSTPLIVASVFGHAAVVEALLAAGALLLPSDEDGTALDNARRNKKAGVRVSCQSSVESLLSAYQSPRTTHYALRTTHYALLTTHYSLLTTHYSLLTTLTTYYLLGVRRAARGVDAAARQAREAQQPRRRDRLRSA